MEQHEMKDSALWSGILLGAVVGVSAMFLIATAIVLVGGQGWLVSAGIGLWVGCVIGPYVGGFAILSGRSVLEERRAHEAPAPAQEDDRLRPAA